MFAAAPADAPPWFGLTFVAMILGAVVFLVGAALVRNAFVARDTDAGDWLDTLLESDGDFARLGGVILLVGLYPFFAPRRRMSFFPWAVMILGLVMAVGPMIYWGWWHRQIPRFSRPGADDETTE